jgi:hypothetical protein
MPKTSGSFKKGHKGVKPKGAINRTTKEARELLEQILLGEVDNIKSALAAVKSKDPAKYLDACSKLFTYVLPKKTDITSDGNSIEPVNITFIRHGNSGK